MTAEQLERWMDFSRRMVNVAINHRMQKKLLALVDHFFWVKVDGNEEQITCWDGGEGEVYLCDEMSDFLWNEGLQKERSNGDIFETKAGTALACCIRAGFDIAVCPSAGVCGFSAGDIRTMYPEGVPEWVKSFFQPGELVSLHETTIEGVFIPEVKGFDSRTFDELPDDAGVWL